MGSSDTHEELELKTSGLLLDGPIDAAISIAVVLMFA